MTTSQSSRYMKDNSLLLYYSQYRYGEISILFLFLFTRFFWKMDRIYHCIYNYNNILIFVIFQIEVSSINFSHKFQIRAIFVFSVTIFWGSQRIPYPLYLYFGPQNQPSFDMYWSSGKKNTCQRLSKIQVMLRCLAPLAVIVGVKNVVTNWWAYM